MKTNRMQAELRTKLIEMCYKNGYSFVAESDNGRKNVLEFTTGEENMPDIEIIIQEKGK